MGGIKLLPTHDEMAGKVTPYKENKSEVNSLNVNYYYRNKKKLRFRAPPKKRKTTTNL